MRHGMETIKTKPAKALFARNFWVQKLGLFSLCPTAKMLLQDAICRKFILQQVLRKWQGTKNEMTAFFAFVTAFEM
jgi:hypothetical protein